MLVTFESPLPVEFREEINVVKTRQEMIAQLIHFLKFYKVKKLVFVYKIWF